MCRSMKPEFTTSYLNRRGLRFEMNGKSLYLNSFYTNSQQKTGFDGYGIPESNAGIFGATAGFNLKSILKVRGMFMTGKDNLDSKTLYSNENPFRAGEIFSLWGEMNMLKNRLQVSGEVSSSDFGSAQEKEELQKESDTAWKAGIKYNHGILSISTDYEEIGNNFNSIANLFLQNDREGLTSNIGLNIKTFSLNVSYLDKKNYMNNPLQDMLHQKRGRNFFQLGPRQPFSHRRRGFPRQPRLRFLDRAADLLVRHEHLQLHGFRGIYGGLERHQPESGQDRVGQFHVQPERFAGLEPSFWAVHEYQPDLELPIQ